MPTNPRIERLTREALGSPAEPVKFPEDLRRALAGIVLVLVVIGLIADLGL